MRGSIQKKGRRYYIVYRLDGKPKWERVPEPNTKKNAEKLLTQRIHEIDRGEYREIQRVSFAEFAERWLRDYVDDPNHVKHSTAHYYHRTFKARLLPTFGSYPLVSITADRIQTFVAEMSREGLSPASIRNYAAPLGKCLKHAVQWGYLRNNPMPSVEMPRLKREEKRFLSPTQVGQLLHNVPDQWKPLFTTAALTGMRLGELLAMRWENLDWDEAQYHVKGRLFLGLFDTPKSIESRRPIDLSPAVLTAGDSQERSEPAQAVQW